MVSNSLRDDQSVWATALGIAVLIYGATGVFYQLQMTLNQFWQVKSNPKSGWKRLIIDRAQSFAFILVIGFLLLISMVLSTGINVLDEFLEKALFGFTFYIVYFLNMLISLAVITGLFALMFKFLPDARIRWKTVWTGAFLTAVLFTIGKFALGIYFGASNPASAYGAAGSIILILLWVSYSSLILFFGAKFTYVYAERYGHGIEPAQHAVRI
jgi:membrane protein